MNKSRIEYASCFSYTPRPTADAQQQDSKRMTINLKNDAMWPQSSLSTSCFMVRHMAQKTIGSLLRDFFASKPILVPIPRSSPRPPNSLWVPQRIAAAMVAEGLGRKTAECLKRVRPVAKSATSRPQDRPKARNHYDSLRAETLDVADDMLLVDDGDPRSNSAGSGQPPRSHVSKRQDKGVLPDKSREQLERF